jgi:hypothetical protein
MFDIVDQNRQRFAAGSAEICRIATRQNLLGPVNFLYMGLFLRFEKIRSRVLTHA